MSNHIGNPSRPVMVAAMMTPGGIACDAVQGRAESLLPHRGDEALVLSGARLLIGQDVEGGPDRTEIEGRQHPGPFDDPRLREMSEGVPAT